MACAHLYHRWVPCTTRRSLTGTQKGRTDAQTRRNAVAWPEALSLAGTTPPAGPEDAGRRYSNSSRDLPSPRLFSGRLFGVRLVRTCRTPKWDPSPSGRGQHVSYPVLFIYCKQRPCQPARSQTMGSREDFRTRGDAVTPCHSVLSGNLFSFVFSFSPLWSCFPDLLGISFSLLKLWLQTWGSSHHILAWMFNLVSSNYRFSCTLECL